MLQLAHYSELGYLSVVRYTKQSYSMFLGSRDVGDECHWVAVLQLLESM